MSVTVAADWDGPLRPTVRPEAVVAFHGYGGDPLDLRPLAAAARAVGLEYLAPQLPAHDGDQETFERAGWSEWLAGTAELVEPLRGRSVVFAGLSLGSLLALHHALGHARLAGVVLLANALWLPAMQRLTLLTLSDRWLPPRIKRGAGHPAERRDTPRRSPFTHYRMAAVRDIDRVGARLRRRLRELLVPTLILHGRNDSMCPVANALRAARRIHAPRRAVIFERSTHVLTRGLQRDAVTDELCSYLGALSPLG